MITKKVNRLETHDRLEHFHQTETPTIVEILEDWIKKRPFGKHPFYLYCHFRTHENGVQQRFIQFPWLVKPSQVYPNSQLYKIYPESNDIKIIWIIPKEEMWANYEKGKMMENEIIYESIQAFKTNKKALLEPETDDLEEYRAQEITRELYPNLFKN